LFGGDVLLVRGGGIILHFSKKGGGGQGGDSRNNYRRGKGEKARNFGSGGKREGREKFLTAWSQPAPGFPSCREQVVLIWKKGNGARISALRAKGEKKILTIVTDMWGGKEGGENFHWIVELRPINGDFLISIHSS